MSLDCTLSNFSTVVVAKEQCSSELEGETVILNTKSGVYFGLNSVGASIWSLIQEPRTVNDVLDAIESKYEVETSQCESELLALLQELQTQGLIEVSNEKVA